MALLLAATSHAAQLHRCPGETADLGGATLHLAVHVDPAVDRALAEALVGGAAAAWSPLGLALEATLDTRAAGLDPSSADALVDALGRLLRARAVPPRPAVDVWLVPRLAVPGSDLDRAAGPVYGLTVAPPLLDDPDHPLARAAPPGGFTPTVLLDAAALARLQPPRRPLVLAHEIGHALGLEHVRDPHNLMAVRPPTCLPLLRPDQAARAVLPGPHASEETP